MADENTQGGDTRDASSASEHSPGAGDAGSGVVGRAVPYSRFRKEAAARHEAEARTEELEARIQSLERQVREDELPDPEEEPIRFNAARTDRLEAEIERLNNELGALNANHDRAARAGALEQQIERAINSHEALQNPALHDLVEEHVMITVAADPSADPAEIVAEVAGRFKGWSAPAGDLESDNPNRDKLRGEPKGGPRNAHLTPDERKEVLSQKGVRSRTLIDRLFRKTRDRASERLANEDKRVIGL